MIEQNWTEQEISILKEKYFELGCNIPELLLYRSKASILQKAYKLGLSTSKKKSKVSLTDEEIELYKTGNIEPLLEKYPRATLYKAAKRAGITQSAIIWTEKEENILREKYPELGSNIPELREKYTVPQIVKKAAQLNIKTISYKDKKIKSRLNATNVMSCGMKCTIVGYRGCNDIDVQFEDGTMVCHTRWKSFVNGNIKHPDINVFSYDKHSCKPITCYGMEFESNKAWCEYFKIPLVSSYTKGMSPEEIVEKYGGHLGNRECFDHLGNHYKTASDKAKKYGITLSMYTNRRRDGWTEEEALTIPKHMYIGEYRVAECLKRLNVKFYHDCSIKTIFKDLGVRVDWGEFLDSLQFRLGLAGINWSKSKIERLRPDFTLYTDSDNKIRGVIEFDGRQHQNFVEYFFKTIEEFLRRSNADFVKQDFFEYMGIPMLRIRDDQVDMIDEMVEDFVNHPESYLHGHNTFLSEEEYWSVLTEQKAKIEAAFAA